MRILLIDNEKILKEEKGVNTMLSNVLNSQIQTVSDEETALYLIKNFNFDLFIIVLNANSQFSGLNLTESIEDDNTPIIFISANAVNEIHDRIKTLKNAIHLIKPFHEYTLESSIRSLLRNKEICVEINKQHFKVNNQQYVSIDSIIYIEVDNNYCILHTSDKKYVMKISMNQILNKLPLDHFILIHRNFAVNSYHIKAVDISKDSLVTSNNIQLTISKRQGKAIKHYFDSI